MAERHSQTSVYTSEFRHEFETDTLNLLSRRLRRFALGWGAVGLLWFLVRWGSAVLQLYGVYVPLGPQTETWTRAQWTLAVLADVVVLAVYGVVAMTVSRWRLSRRRLAEVPAAMILAEMLMRLIAWTMVRETNPLLMTTLSHVVACLFLPWNFWNAMKPMIAVLALNLAFKLTAAETVTAGHWLGLGLSPLAALPGGVVSWLRHSRRIEQFKINALSRRYGEFRRELLDARKIHESMFPRAVTGGAVTFWYEYEPMRAIGGDFVFTSTPDQSGGRCTTVVLVDVTGHGIAAALTVNRLYGELERVFGEAPDVSPGEVLKLLNRYIHLTMAKHSVYATAVVMKIDPQADTVEYSSGGHPPAFLRGVDGTIEELESTGFVLGVCSHEDFEPDSRTLRFGPGDAIIAYTDGASEARDERGRMLGVKGMRAILAGTPVHISQLARRSFSNRPLDELCGSWCRTILQAVEGYRHGPPDDDTLVVEITRPLTHLRKAEGARAKAEPEGTSVAT